MDLQEGSRLGGGLGMTWHAVHRTGDGRLIDDQVKIPVPQEPNCIKPSCLWKYVIDSIRYALIVNYHMKRSAYAQANPHKEILERYRTGEPSPQTIWQAIHANIKLKCPVCRKYNVDPLLFRR